MGNEHVMSISELESAIEWQAEHAAKNHAPCTARIVRAIMSLGESGTRTAERIANWQGLTLRDAMPLRFTGALHHLMLTGTDNRLADVYSGAITNQDTIDTIVCDMVREHDALINPWLDGPPQTNEAGRGASIMAGVLWLAQRVAPRFELNELGASAGVNTMLDRYHFTLGETTVGPQNSPMRIAPEWRGTGFPPAPGEGFEIVSVKACDVAPVDLSDPAQALKLKAYVWPDAPGRLERIDAAIALASAAPPDLVQQDAGDFVEEVLARPQDAGTTKAIFHSIMWQYMPPETQARIMADIEHAGAKASAERPLAVIALETDPETFRHELKVRYWNGSTGDGAAHLLSFAHPHGAWVEWIGAD